MNRVLAAEYNATILGAVELGLSENAKSIFSDSDSYCVLSRSLVFSSVLKEAAVCFLNFRTLFSHYHTSRPSL